MRIAVVTNKLESLARKVIDAGMDLFQLSAQSMTLEDVFVELTTEEKEVGEEVSA